MIIPATNREPVNTSAQRSWQLDDMHRKMFLVREDGFADQLAGEGIKIQAEQTSVDIIQL
jgi:hypothetical protein